MADQWYFAWDENRQGPFTATQLMELAEQGKLQPRDTVWKDGIEQGILAEQIHNLFPDPPAEALPETASPAVAEEPVSSLKPSTGFSASDSDKPPTLPPWLTANKDRDIQRGPQTPIPDGLTLQEIHENDSSEPVPPVKGAAEAAPPEGAERTPRPPPAPPPTKQGRAISARGAVLINQDGRMVQYRKKCLKCGHEDPSKTTMPIRNGVTRGSFFCPKCRKAGAVEIHCVI